MHQSAVVVDVLEQLLARQLLTAANQPGHPLIGDRDVVPLAALADEPDANRRALDADVLPAEGREPVRLVRGGVALVAHAHVGALEERHHEGDHPSAPETGPR